jgi:hypothetical protein
MPAVPPSLPGPRRRRPGPGLGGTAEPELAAALAVAAYRTVRLQALRAILAGEDPAGVAARHPERIRSALSTVDQMTA